MTSGAHGAEQAASLSSSYQASAVSTPGPRSPADPPPTGGFLWGPGPGPWMSPGWIGNGGDDGGHPPRKLRQPPAVEPRTQLPWCTATSHRCSVSSCSASGVRLQTSTLSKWAPKSLNAILHTEGRGREGRGSSSPPPRRPLCP